MKKQVLLVESDGKRKIFAVGQEMELLLDGIEGVVARVFLPSHIRRPDRRHLLLLSERGKTRYYIIDLETLFKEWEDEELSDGQCLDEILEEISF